MSPAVPHSCLAHLLHLYEEVILLGTPGTWWMTCELLSCSSNKCLDSLLKWPKYGFVGLIVLVWRSVEVAYWKIPLEENFSDLDPKAFCRAATVAMVDFYVSEVPHNKEQDSSSSALPVFLKQLLAIHHNPPVMWIIPPFFSYSYE